MEKGKITNENKPPEKGRRFFNMIRIAVCAAALILGALIFALFNTQKEWNYIDLDAELNFVLLNSGDIIETIRGGLKMQSETIRISFYAEGEYMDNIAELVAELMDRAMEETGDPEEGDYIFYQYGGYTCEYGHTEVDGGYRYTVIITPEYYMDAEQAEEVNAAVEEILAGFALPDDASDYEKFMAVYNYLFENCSYDKVHKDNTYYMIKCTAYGALVYNTAVCQGICVAMYRLLGELDVSCRVISGLADVQDEAENHTWLIVGIDGLYYNVDITADILSGTHDWLLKCDESFENHERDDKFLTDVFLNAYPMAESDY